MSPTERYNRFSSYVLQTNSLVQVNNGIAPVYHTNWKNFQPRLGFSWDPFKSRKTSVRAGYAILADQPVTNLVIPNGSNPPFATTVALPTTIPTVKLSNATSVAVAQTWRSALKQTPVDPQGVRAVACQLWPGRRSGMIGAAPD